MQEFWNFITKPNLQIMKKEEMQDKGTGNTFKKVIAGAGGL
jgi:hypothetical protein